MPAKLRFDKAVLLLFASFIAFQSCVEFQKIAQGTGDWLGGYSLKWGVFYGLYLLFCVLLVVISGVALFRRKSVNLQLHSITALRARLGFFRYGIVALILFAPIWFFQLTPWGIVFSGPYFRIVVWFLVVTGMTFFLGQKDELFGWHELLASIVLTAGGFAIAATFLNVTDYPFSVGWSEGNRMYDYSAMFGRNRYVYPADKEIQVLLDPSRQFIGGVPFLYPGLTIGMERFWLGLMTLFPYLLLGVAALRFSRNELKIWALTVLWALLFLRQGPIHTPLVLCAVAVALLWRSPLWLAIPIISVTGYVAEESRYTWLFAPGLWIGMLELAGAGLQNGKISRVNWFRAVLLGAFGAFGGYFGQSVIGFFTMKTSQISGVITPTVVSNELSADPLLWYRLFPNATYETGVLIGLAFAVVPLIVILAYLAATRKWLLNSWQSLAIGLPLLAFLVVGAIVSSKIGGGGDLHNMDMFLIGLLFAGALAWEKGGRDWMRDISAAPSWIKAILVLTLALPGYSPLLQLRSFAYFGDDVSWLVTLTGAQSEKDLELLPPRDVSDRSLEIIQREAALAQEKGDVLFMSQRQLLTFGFIKDIPLIAEYEKKDVMNRAVKSDRAYFDKFYADLAAHRFSLIVTDPLFTLSKDETYTFGEENNAWVKWVSAPLLCYYEQMKTLKEVKVQLLIPKTEPVDCSSVLP